jgi:RHS repeat-associated protein
MTRKKNAGRETFQKAANVAVVPDPMNGQAYNRYSYVLNGPLNAIDPSGHFGCVNR